MPYPWPSQRVEKMHPGLRYLFLSLALFPAAPLTAQTGPDSHTSSAPSTVDTPTPQLIVVGFKKDM